MKLTLLCLFMIAVSLSWAQTDENVTSYFSKNGLLLPDSSARAVYYQRVQRNGTRYKVQFYRISDRSLAMEAECSSIQPSPQLDGLVKYYYANGTLKESKKVTQYKIVGRRDLFYDNGNLKIAFDYGSGQVRLVEARSRDGKNLIPNGHGIVPLDLSEELNVWHLQRDDAPGNPDPAKHVIVRDYRETGVLDVYAKGDTLYWLGGDQKVAYQGGDKQFDKDIAAVLYYPEAARRLKIEGVTRVKFVVRPNGEVDSIYVTHGFDPAADREAVVAIRKIRGWVPGRHNNKAVSMWEEAQVNFTLSKADRKTLIPEPFPDRVNYFDEGWRLISDSAHAAYIRRVESKPKYDLVRDYFRSGALRMEAECSAYSPRLVHNGKTTAFYENGYRQMEGFFKDNEPVGIQRLFYVNGKPEKVIDYSSKPARLLHAFSEDGVDLLAGGAAADVSKDSVYTEVEKQAEYVGGLQAMARFIGSNLRYPASAVRQRASGTVFVSFIIDPDGSHHSHQVVQGFHPDCDQEALRVVSGMSPWLPARVNGVPVASTFVLPIKFKIER